MSFATYSGRRGERGGGGHTVYAQFLPSIAVRVSWLLRPDIATYEAGGYQVAPCNLMSPWQPVKLNRGIRRVTCYRRLRGFFVRLSVRDPTYRDQYDGNRVFSRFVRRRRISRRFGREPINPLHHRGSRTTCASCPTIYPTVPKEI